MDRDEGPWMGAIGQGRPNQDDAVCIELNGLFFSLGGFWLGGILAWGDIDRVYFVWGDFGLGGFVLGGFCLGGFCPGGFVQGDFVQGDFVLSLYRLTKNRLHSTVQRCWS